MSMPTSLLTGLIPPRGPVRVPAVSNLVRTIGAAERVSWVLTPAVATTAAGCATRWVRRTRDRYLHQPPKEELVCDV